MSDDSLNSTFFVLCLLCLFVAINCSFQDEPHSLRSKSSLQVTHEFSICRIGVEGITRAF